MKILKVPYAEKDEAKGLGARWNSARKAWYVPDGVDEAPFSRWFAAGGSEGASAAGGTGARSGASRDSYSGDPVTGKYYVELAHDCSPFTVCPQCAPLLAKSGWSEAHAALTQMVVCLHSTAK